METHSAPNSLDKNFFISIEQQETTPPRSPSSSSSRSASCSPLFGRKVEMRKYGYSARKNNDQRRNAIEHAVLEHGINPVKEHLTKISKYDEKFKKDLEELQLYGDEIEYIRNTNIAELIDNETKKIQNSFLQAHSLVTEYRKSMATYGLSSKVIEKKLKRVCKEVMKE